MKLCSGDNHYTTAPAAQKTFSPKKFYQVDGHQHFKMELLGAVQSLQGNLLSRELYAQETSAFFTALVFIADAHGLSR